MGTSSSVRFAESVRIVAAEARRLGLIVPAFRSPPSLAQFDRTIARRPDPADCTISIRVVGRPFAAVQADIVEGTLLVNQRSPEQDCELRRALWAILSVRGATESGPTLVAA